MSSRLTVAEVERIAALSYLELTPEEKELFAIQLADILTYAEQVQGIDTSGVQATAHVHADEPVERPDELSRSLPTDDVIANAPDAVRNPALFRVPRVIG